MGGGFSRAAVWMLLPLAAGVAWAASTELDVQLGLAYGVDSNPYQLSAGESDGSFANLSLDAAYGVRLGHRTQLFLEAGGRSRIFGAALSDADTTRGGLVAGLAVIPYSNRQRRFAVLMGGELKLGRSTFIDPRTGNIFEYDDGSSLTPIPDRFDYNSTEGFVDLRWRLNRRVRLSLDTRLAQRNYLEDYDQVSSLESLDYSSVSIEPGILFQVGRLTSIRLSYLATDRDYDEQPAVDPNGGEVSGALRQYRYAGYRLALLLEPSGATALRLGLRGLERNDEHAGYYDSTASTVYLSLGQRFGRNNELLFYISQFELDYDNATVNNDPNGEIRSGGVVTALGRFERRLPLGFQWFAELATQRADNEDPTLAYDRDWAMTGFRYTYSNSSRERGAP